MSEKALKKYLRRVSRRLLALLLALYIWYVQSSEIVIANETIMTIDQYQSYVERVKP